MIDYVCGSPRGKESTSAALLKMICPDARVLCLPGEQPENETVILAFPLYFDGIPAKTLEALSALPAGCRNIYAVCNCGYYEGSAATPALCILRAFCARTGRRYLGGMGIGAGAMAISFPRLPEALHPHKKARAALRELSFCARHTLPFETRFFEPAVPKRLYMRAVHGLFRLRAKRLRL